MKYTKIRDIVAKDYGEDIALYVVLYRALNITKKLKLKHIMCKGLFTKQLEEKFRDLMWNAYTKDVELAIDIGNIFHAYEVRLSSQGIGGCVFKSIPELLREEA